MNKPSNSGPIANSQLMLDLCSDSRESVYRAITYLHHSGAPISPDGPNDIETLRTLREPMSTWLLSVPDPETIVGGYGEFVERWSPMFRD